MDRKSRAARTSLVAAFIAAGGSVASTAPAQASPQPVAAVAGTSQLQWGDELVRFLKLDGFPAYLKVDGFAQLAQYYKWREDLLPELSGFYKDNQAVVDDVLALYHKANAGPLTGILIGLEQYYKYKDSTALTDYLKSPDALKAYYKVQSFLDLLQQSAPDAFEFFYKETGIEGAPRIGSTD